jgi:hypothetical protein
MKIAKDTLKSHNVCVFRDSKYVTKDVKCYNYGSLMIVCTLVGCVLKYIPNFDVGNTKTILPI